MQEIAGHLTEEQVGAVAQYYASLPGEQSGCGSGGQTRTPTGTSIARAPSRARQHGARMG